MEVMLWVYGLFGVMGLVFTILAAQDFLRWRRVRSSGVSYTEYSTRSGFQARFHLFFLPAVGLWGAAELTDGFTRRPEGFNGWAGLVLAVL